MPNTTTIDTTGDLLDIVSGWTQHSTLAREYITLLHDAATEGVRVGVLETAVEAEALSDWEAAAMISDDIYPGKQGVEISDVGAVREALCRSGPVVVEHGHRKGNSTYALHLELV
jgi:hypothetical protein